MSVKCSEVTKYIENLYPLYMAEDYDNVGLIIGDYNKNINNILVCLEINIDVVKEAINNKVDMIIAHHPLIFKSLKKITTDNHISRMVMDLIRNNINVYAMHTNFDNSDEGMNDLIARKLELKEIKKLSNNKSINLFKIAVYVPKTHEDIVRDAMFKAGAGYIGNYSHCSFNIDGTGTFMPHEGTAPYIGSQEVLESVNEVKIETIARESEVNKIISSVIAAHPYEEPAYDIYLLDNKIEQGTGRFGILDKDYKLAELCQYIKEKMDIPYLNVCGNLEQEIRQVAVVGGAGSDFINDALKNKCDVIITGDVKHHVAIDAVQMGISIIDAGHYFTEVIAVPYISTFIENSFPVNCINSKVNTNPFNRV